MLAILSTTPKWLVGLIVLCVFDGYAEQVNCKFGGCKTAVTSAHADSGKQNGESPSDESDQHCQCQCHFMTLAFYQVPAPYSVFVRVVNTEPIRWSENAPEAPCAEIEHPPQLA